MTVEGVKQTTTDLMDEFAPAQFLNLSDDDELASPSFEAFAAGVALGDGHDIRAGDHDGRRDHPRDRF